ncbi:MAG: endonuclease/exonuclease/phosphatase family protein [Tepidisphaeraceae bacterium]
MLQPDSPTPAPDLPLATRQEEEATAVALRRWKRAGVLQWLFAIGLFTYVAFLKYGADRWGWATVLAYAPRWPTLLPAVVILLGALIFRRKPWLTIFATLVAGVWLMDVRVPVPRFGHGTTPLRILTLNADGGSTAGRGTDLERIGKLIAETRPNIIFFQEWRRGTPPPLPGDVQWNVRRESSHMIVTRLPVDSVAMLPPTKLKGGSGVFGASVTFPDGKQGWLFTPHMETPRGAFNKVLRRDPQALEFTAENAERRLEVSQAALAWMRDLAGDAEVLIGGDFNLVGDGHIFRSTWASAFGDAFATAGWGTGGTKLQDYWRVRIDHILTGRAWRARKCWVGQDVGSDHLPLIADVERVGD